MKTKLQQIREAWADDRRIDALNIARKFPRLGDEKEAITTAWAAYSNSQFYRDIGKDPDQLITTGLKALQKKYQL